MGELVAKSDHHTVEVRRDTQAETVHGAERRAKLSVEWSSSIY